MIIAYELQRSAVAAADELYAISSLQELLELALEQVDNVAQTSDQRQTRISLLLTSYLHQAKPCLETLKQEITEVRQQIALLSEFEGVRHG